MANDMMRQIEMELAKRERAKTIDTPWWADYAAKAISQIPAQRERAAQWEERKNSRMMHFMDTYSEGYDKTFDMDNINKKESRVKQYIEKNQEKMSGDVLEYSNVILQNIGDHRQKVFGFNQAVENQERDTENWTQAIDEFSKQATLVPDDISKIRDMVGQYVADKGDMMTSYADFLGLPQHNHVLTMLAGKEKAVRDVLNQAKDDNYLDEGEVDYLTQAMETSDYGIIDRQAKIKDVDDSLKVDHLVKEPGGLQETITLYNQAEEDGDLEQLAAYEEKLMALDDRYKEIMNTSYVKDFVKGLSWIDDQGGLSSGQKTELKKLGYDEGQMSSMDIKSASSILKLKKRSIDQKTVDDSSFGSILTDIPAPVAYGAAVVGAPLAVKASKFVADQAVKGAKYIQFVTKLPAEDIIKFYDDGNIKRSIKGLEPLMEKMKNFANKPNSADYKAASKALNTRVDQVVHSLTKGSGKKSPVLTKMNPADLKKLLMNAHKWRLTKLKANAFKLYPQLAKGFLKNAPAGGYATFSLAKRIGEAVGDPTGGLATGAAAYYGGRTKIFKKIKDKMSEKGSKWVYQKLIKKLPAKMAQKYVSAIALAKHPTAGVVLGTGMVLWDIVDIVSGALEEEE